MSETTTPLAHVKARLLEPDINALALLVMKLGEVERGTRHPDGVTPETDTTHSLMLALVATRIAYAEDPDLNATSILYLSLVHDMVEAYAGDTVTLRKPDADAQADKDAREAAALERIRVDLPWLAATIDRYERQDTREARLVKLVDKMLPKLTHAANNYGVLVDHNMGAYDLRDRMAGQLEDYGAADLPVTTALFASTSKTLLDGYAKYVHEHCGPRCHVIADVTKDLPCE